MQNVKTKNGRWDQMCCTMQMTMDHLINRIQLVDVETLFVEFEASKFNEIFTQMNLKFEWEF